MSRRSRNSILRLVLALALVAAQLGAQAHAYSHLRNRSDFSTDPTRQCAVCLAFAPVLSAAGSPDSTILVFSRDAGTAVCVAVDSLIEQPLLHAFRSRAPPQLL